MNTGAGGPVQASVAPAGPALRRNGEIVSGLPGIVLTPDDAWLQRQEPEEALAPRQPIIDAHHHLWDWPGFRYLLPEFARDAKAQDVVATVFVECGSMYRTKGPEPLRPVGETSFVLEQVARYKPVSPDDRTGLVARVVGFADLRFGAAVEDVLQAQIAAGAGRFAGVRFSAAWDASPAIRNVGPADRPGVLTEPGVLAGLAAVAAAGLAFDTYVFFPQLDDVAALADRMPELCVVVNHCGGPLSYGPYADDREKHYRHWRRAIGELAKRPNVHCKLGGLISRTTDIDYFRSARPPTSAQLAASWRKWVEPCVEAFGAGRCMFASNFPVDKMGVSYGTLWNGFKRLAAGASAAERDQLFRGTAARVYGVRPS